MNLFTIDNKKLHNRYICQEHFPPDSFTNRRKKNRLLNSAIPYQYGSEEQLSMSLNFDVFEQDNFNNTTQTYTHSNPEIVELVLPTPIKTKVTDEIQMPNINLKRKYPWKYDSFVTENCYTDTPRKLKLKQKRKGIHNKITLASKLKQINGSFNMRNNLKKLVNSFNFCSISSKALVTMQLKDRCRPWTLNEKNLALNLFYKSPIAYKFLLSQKVNLPGPSTIRRWIAQSKLLPDLSKLFVSHLHKKFELSDYKEKACTVCFDEMNIQELLEYSKEFNFIEGFEDLRCYGKTDKSAKCVFVLARGIYSSWKYPIGYFLTHSRVNKINFKQLIIDILQKLFDVGLCPKAIVCDQAMKNQSTLKSLNISEENPFFFINNNKITYLYM